MPAPFADLLRPREQAALPSWTSLDQEERAERTRRRLRSADLLVTAAWVSVAVAIGLFLVTGGAATVHGLAGTVTAAGIVAGLAATDLLLVMLVLVARVPVIDRTFGHDRALAAHRRIGKPALYLLLVHAVLLTLGYGLADGANPLRETIALLTSRTDMLLAYLALLLLIAVVVTSLVAVRRKLQYEVWHLVHLLSYAGVAVAIPHELSQGAVLSGPLERVYWMGLYVIALGAIAVHRVAKPVVVTFRHRMRVEGVEWLAPDVFSLHLGGHALRRFGATGGQFAVWRFWSLRTWWHAHPISFSSSPTATGIRLTVRVLGDGTERLGRLRRGTFVSVQGPYGVFTDRARSAPFLTVIAAGIGITPIRALLEDSPLRPGEATVLLRAGGPDQRFLWHEVIELVERSGGTAYTMTGHRPRGLATWMSARAVEWQVSLARVFPHLLESDVYVCGPQGWTDLVVADVRRAGVPKHRIHVERFES